MLEIAGNVWHYYDQGHWIAITTNGAVRNDGAAVMGRGVAYEAAQRFPEMQAFLGRVLSRSGNHVWPLVSWRIFTFPVKWHWKQPASLQLIEYSAHELADKFKAIQTQQLVKPIPTHLFMVRPGCGNGRLTWAEVKPVIAPILNDQFIVVEKNA